MPRTIVSTPDAPAAIGPYSQAVKANGFVFCSGQIPLDPTSGELVTGSIETQARRVLDNLSAVLDASGSSLDRVVKATVFLADMDDYGAVNDVYAEYFGHSKPARAAVAVDRLPKDVGLEIEAIALCD